MRRTRRISLGNPEPHQRELIYSTAFRRAFIGGVGSGKSWAAVMLALRASVMMPGVPGVLANATYPLLRDTTLAEWRLLVPPEAYEWRAAEHRIVMRNGTPIYCRSMDKPLKRVAGWSIGWAVYDEAGIARDASGAKMLLQRIRSGPPELRFLALVTSPRGWPWLQEWCERADRDGNRPHLINATTYDNPHTGELYKRELEEDFPPGSLDHAQEMMGQFICRTGLLYGDHFREAVHVVPLMFDPDLPYTLGWDPGLRASGVVAFQERSRGRQVAVLEWARDGEATEDTARRILSDTGRRPRAIYLDTPSKLNTRTGVTDVQAIQAVMGRGVRIQVLAGRVRSTHYRHTAVRTALNSGRLLFSSALVRQRAGHEDRGIIRSLRTMPWADESSRDERVEEKDPRKHIVDALEFGVAMLLPPRFYDPTDRRAERERVGTEAA